MLANSNKPSCSSGGCFRIWDCYWAEEDINPAKVPFEMVLMGLSPGSGALAQL